MNYYQKRRIQPIIRAMVSSLITTIIIILTGCVEAVPTMGIEQMPDSTVTGTAPAETPNSESNSDTPDTTNMSLSPMLSEIAIITESETIDVSATAIFVLVASYSDGSVQYVTSRAVWSTAEGIGHFTQPGTYQSPTSVDNDTYVTIEASYEENGQTYQASFDLTIKKPNQAPTIDQGDYCTYTIDTGNELAGANQLILNAQDAENENLFWEIASDSALTHGQANIISQNNNEITIKYSPYNASFTGLDSFKVTVSDPWGASDYIYVKVAVVQETLYARDFAGGFNATDATNCLQTAINSGASRLVITNEGSPWIVGPISLASNQEIIFEPGVIVQAKSNDASGLPFKDHKCLFTAKDKQNIRLVGYDAIFTMNKSEYTTGEQRHVLAIAGATNITVEGVTLQQSGGDGIYIGEGSASGQKYSKNVLIKNVVCTKNKRNGISIISAEDLTIDGCNVNQTSGVKPESGIDIEPNAGDYHRLVNINILNTTVANNNNYEITMGLHRMTSNNPDVSINLNNIQITGRLAFQVMGIHDNGPKGYINCKNINIDGAECGIFVSNKSALSASLKFEDCTLSNIGTLLLSPITINARPLPEQEVLKPGGIEFVNCKVIDTYDRPAIRFGYGICENGKDLWNVTGNILVNNPFGASYTDKNPIKHDVTLSVLPF